MSEASNRWYKQNKDRVNSARAARYKANPAYRGKILESQQQYRDTHPSPSSRGASRMKMVNGKLVETFRISEVAVIIGRSLQTIRAWHSAGWLPPTTIPSPQRFYTINQVRLMSDLASVVSQTRHAYQGAYQSALQSKINEIKALWAL